METNTNDDSSNQIDFAKVPIIALRQRSRFILSRALNPVKVLPSEEGYPRDWRGVAHLAGLQALHAPVINGEADPMSKILSLWCTEGDNETANFDNLVKLLGAIDRWDVADDLSETLNAQAYKSKAFQKQLIASRHGASNSFNVADVNNLAEAQKPDVNILTKDDVERSQLALPPQQYDAFVLFADEDIEFATELIVRMEEDHPRFGFKLCTKDRDLIGGISFEHEAIMRLIAERCNRLIVIVSTAFFKSSANTFFVNFAHALQIEQRRRKIVPCLYENCVLPPTLSFYFHLKYHQSGKLFNFWDKLSDSIRSTNPIANSNAVPEISAPSIQIKEITDSLTQQAAIAAPPSPSATASNIAPVKLPRMKGTKTTKVNDAMKVHTKPEPKIRSAFSLNQLNAQPQTMLLSDGNANNGHHLSVTNCDMNQSETNLSQISATQSTRSNKSTWFKKLLSSSNANLKANVSVTNSTKSCDSITKPKSKRRWLKMRLTSSTT